MHNVILFPVVRCLEDGLWHGCRRYRHVGEVKQAVSAKDWKRIYDWDLRRMLREGLLAAEPAAGNGALLLLLKTVVRV